ncbi:MAG: galactokinase [Dehalococcoidia bacterium]|nr:galactokinase [Dehalococcoidia bacterium]
MTDSLETAAREGFAAAYGHAPTVVVRAPGRVNLIGEHTDYSHLPVLPIAIDRALWVAAAPADDGAVELRSAAFDGVARFAREEESAPQDWTGYLAGAVRELAGVAPGRGARVFVTGDLPAASGLSSSSAFTVGLIAALNAAWEAGLDREAIVERAIVAERHTGVETGGMDQAAIAFAEAGAALRIDFEPAARRAVPLPAGLAFVVASSGEAAPKGAEAREAYNARVVGARLAAAMLCDQIGVDIGTPPRLGDVADTDVVEVLVDDLPEKISAKEVAHGVDLGVAVLTQLTADTFSAVAKVPVRRVARHILAEAQRVEAAERALLAGDLAAFGKLLNESHDSLRNDFQCSTPALDRLCAAMRKAGAFGARLTGAGFGGYGLAVVAPERVQAVIDAAIAATGGPAFEVHASPGYEVR